MKTTCAIDAALNHSGYVIYDNTTFVKTGIFTPHKNMSLQNKLLAISEWLSGLIEKYKVNEVAIEGCYTARNPKTAYQLSLVHGVIILTAGKYGVKVTVIPPAKVKRVVAGRGNAGKDDIAKAIIALYNNELSSGYISERPYVNDITDAIAILHTYLYDEQANSEKKGKKCKLKNTTTRKRMKPSDIKENTAEEV